MHTLCSMGLVAFLFWCRVSDNLQLGLEVLDSLFLERYVCRSDLVCPTSRFTFGFILLPALDRFLWGVFSHQVVVPLFSCVNMFRV